MMKVVRRLSRRCLYVVSVKFVLMGRLMKVLSTTLICGLSKMHTHGKYCVGRIVCCGQGRTIFYFD